MSASKRKKQNQDSLVPCILKPDAHIAAKAASFLSYAGRPQEAVASVKRAMRLNPHHPDWYFQELGLALYVAGPYSNAISAFNRIANLVEFDHAYLAACCVELGEKNQARASDYL